MRRWPLFASALLIATGGVAGLGGNAWAATSPGAPVTAKATPHLVAGHETFKAGSKQVVRLDPTPVTPQARLRPYAAQNFAALPVTAKINVTYIGFSAPARAAFQAAVNIWQTHIHSSVPIDVVADWSNLTRQYGDPYILGAAGPTSFVENFPNAPQPNVAYPVALANAIADSDQLPSNVCNSDPSFQDASGAEITASFNSAPEAPWYFGTGTFPAGAVDFESVVLHELGHGLGFVGTFDGLDPSTGNDAGKGYFGLTSDGSNPTVFDTLTSDGSGTPLTSYANGSLALGNVLRGGANGARWNGPTGVANNGGTRPLLFSPGPSSPYPDQSWEEGSSFSHLDEDTYPASSGDALMTPALHSDEIEHTVDPIVLGMFQDMGWPTSGAPAATTGDYHVAAPMRLVSHATVRNGAPARVQVIGRDNVPSGATSVAVNIAVQIPSIAGYFATLPGCGWRAGMPNTQNFAARQTRTSLAVLPVDDTGAITVAVGASGNAAVSAIVSVDLVGWYGSGGGYYHQLPSPKLAFLKMVGTTAVDLPILGVAGVPKGGVTAVVVTAGVGFESTTGVVVVGPGGTTSVVPTVAYNRGELITNLAIVPVNAGKLRVRTTAGVSAVVLNVVGWYGPSAAGGQNFHSAGPAHLTAAPRGQDVTIGGLPGSAQVMLDVHLLRPSATATLTAGPGGTSSLAPVQQFMAGQSGSGTFITTTNAAGQVRLHLSSGAANFYTDFQGWFSP